MATTVDPVRVYMVNAQVCQLQCAPVAVSSGNNQSVISAVTGQRIRVMGMTLQSNTGTATAIEFKSNSGGSVIFTSVYVPLNTSPPWILEIKDSGYFETSTGHGLFADNTSQTVRANVFYITYTPV